MKKIILTTIALFLLGVMCMFSYSAYQYYRAIHSDDPIDPYLQVLIWSATIVRDRETSISLIAPETYTLEETDVIITRASSDAVIHWPDRSETRLGPDSRLTIDRMRVLADYSSIEIELSLERGKNWTRVVRTLYPGSYFRMRLPDNGIVAGVRGSTFEVNLDRHYIQSVDHALALTDRLGQTVTLLPGELVDSRNILLRLTSSILDTSWNTINALYDQEESLRREALVQTRLALLSGWSEVSSYYDRLIRWILSLMPGFGDIRIFESIQDLSLDRAQDITEENLLRAYQYVQDKKFVQERERIRTLLIEKWKASNKGSIYLESLGRGALWDSIGFSGMTLESANTLGREYAKTLNQNIDTVLGVIPLRDLDTRARETLRSLVK
jgi:FecR protein